MTTIRKLLPLFALASLVVAMGGTWTTSNFAEAAPAPAAAAAPASGSASAMAQSQPTAQPPAPPGPPQPPHAKSGHRELSGKLNLNTANEDQLQLLPTVGPAKADRIVEWRKKNGGFKRTADLRRVKGFGYRSFKKLEPFLDIKGDTTLAVKQ